MRKQISMLLGIVCLFVFAFGMYAKAPPVQTEQPTMTKKQVVNPDCQMTTVTDSILNEQPAGISGDYMQQLTIGHKSSFETSIRIPEAPVFATEHVPLL